MTTPESSENRETVGSGTAESVAARASELPTTLRTYAEQLPVVLSVPNLKQVLRDAADEIERLREEVEALKEVDFE